MRKSSLQNQSGQIAVIVLLIMVILLVMGLSLATRTTQESFFSQQSSETARVWNAAESGAEDALSQIASNPSIDPSSISIDTDINNSDVSAIVTSENTIDMRVDQLSTVTVNLEKASPLTSFEIAWARDYDACYRSALLVSVYYAENSVTKVAHYTLTPNGVSGDCPSWLPSSRGNDGFTKPTITAGAGRGFSLTEITASGNYVETQARIFLPANSTYPASFTGVPLFARIKPLYHATDISVSASDILPAQTHIVTSTATNAQENSVGSETRTVQATRTLPAAPNILDYALYSGGSITKPVVPYTPPATNSYTPLGYHDSAKCSISAGWACDPDFDGSIKVHIYRGGDFIGEATANQNCGSSAECQTIASECGSSTGNKRFSFPLNTTDSSKPDFVSPGDPIYAYALNVNSSGGNVDDNGYLTNQLQTYSCP